MPSLVPATTISMSAVSICLNVGLIIKVPSLKATLVAATGPSNGISEITTAALDAITAIISEGFTMSVETHVGIIWISRPNSFLKSGLIGRSIRRETRISLSFGLPSRLINPPGILPAA